MHIYRYRSQYPSPIRRYNASSSLTVGPWVGPVVERTTDMLLRFPRGLSTATPA